MSEGREDEFKSEMMIPHGTTAMTLLGSVAAMPRRA